MSHPESFANYINGDWVTADDSFEVRNPANTDEIVGICPRGTTEDIAAAATSSPGGVRRLVGDAWSRAGQAAFQSGRDPGKPAR